MGIFVTVILIGKRLDPRQRAAITSIPTNCHNMQINKGITINGTLSDQFVWYDSNCKIRSASLGRNNNSNPKSGIMHQFIYDLGTNIRIVNGSSGTWQGFGYAANHYSNTADHTNGRIGTYTTPLSGENHAIHEYKWRMNLPNPVDVIVQWFFATGRSNPIYAITYDSRPSSANANMADSRSPYGDMEWTGNANDQVEFVGWGDRFKFKTLTTPLNFNSRWDYSEPNTIPYAKEWSVTKDAEMGIVQTQTYQQHDGGGYWAYNFWGKNSETPGNVDTQLLEPGGKMPASWTWTYQLNQYEIPFQNPVTSKRLAWGLNYGSIGQTNYNVYGDDQQSTGYPFQSYSVYVVLDKYSDNPVLKQVEDVEAVQKSNLTATIGSVVTQGPGGAGRTDNITYQPIGYNQIFGTWEVTANSQSESSFTLNTNNGELINPIFVINNYKGTIPNTILVNGQVKQKNIDYMPTLDISNNKLYFTLLGLHANSTQIQVSPNSVTPTVPNITSTLSPTPTPQSTFTPTPTIANGKIGDLNNDGSVGIIDLSILLSNWSTTNTTADVNKDGTVGILDLSILLSNWNA